MTRPEPEYQSEDAPRTTRAVMAIAFGVVALLVAAAVVYSVRFAVVGMALVAFLAALMRAFAPSRWAFGVRRRPVDVAILLILAGALAILGLTTVLD
jgi:hypothetical protein